MAIGAGSARAATYGSSGFGSNAEGWQTTKNECKVLGVIELELLCKNEAGFSAATGNPPGSLATKAKVLVNIGGIVKSTTTYESPVFTVGDGGEGSVNLQRAFDPGGLVELTPALSYTATLVDKTSGQQQKAIAETLNAASAFGSKSGGVSLVTGHRYVVVIESEISVSLAGLSLGSATVSYDNVAVSGPGSGPENPNGGPGGNGENGANGANGLTNSKLESLIQSSLTGPATIKGNKIFVKAKCPAQVGVACKTTVQGMVKKGKPATAPRTAKISKGKAKQLVLKVKPAAKSKVAKKKRMLFKVTVKAGSAHATIYKTLKLIRR